MAGMRGRAERRRRFAIVAEWRRLVLAGGSGRGIDEAASGRVLLCQGGGGPRAAEFAVGQRHGGCVRWGVRRGGAEDRHGWGWGCCGSAGVRAGRGRGRLLLRVGCSRGTVHGVGGGRLCCCA